MESTSGSLSAWWPAVAEPFALRSIGHAERPLLCAPPAAALLVSNTVPRVTTLLDGVHPTWIRALEPVLERVGEMDAFLAAETAAGRAYLPAREHVMRAFTAPFDRVRVLVVGQDPYPTPGHAIGLSFSVGPAVRPVPRTLRTILAELAADVGCPVPPSGDLTRWADQGVLLLNRVLTVREREIGSHRRKGWEAVTEQAVRALAGRGTPLVAVLWGKDAQTLLPLLDGVPAVCTAHPSPMSAARGFIGSRPFGTVNRLLAEQGAAPVDWRLG